MLFSYLVLATSVSIDSLGIGITYGIRKTKISFISKIILFIISFAITSISVYIGNILSKFLPEFLTKLIGTILLICMGIWIIYQSLYIKKHYDFKNITNKKTYNIFLKSLGITIQIIRDPKSSDLDSSNLIDSKEALYLGLAMSIDSICVGIGSSIIGFTSIIFPLFVATFQLIFLSTGTYLGKKITTICNIPENIWSRISGILLILIGISKFFI